MAGPVRRSCANPLNARAHGPQQPNNIEHDDHTSRGETALSSRRWLHDVGGTPWRNTQSEAAPLKPSLLVNEDGWGTRVEKAGYNWLSRLVTPAATETGYVGWLRRLVTPAGYGDWLRWWWTEAHGVETIEVETKTGRYKMTKGRDDGIVKWRSNKVAR